MIRFLNKGSSSFEDYQTCEDLSYKILGDNWKYDKSGLVAEFPLDFDTMDKFNLHSATNYGLLFTYDKTLKRNVAECANNRYARFTTENLPKTTFTLSILAKSNGNNTASNNMIFGYGQESANKSCTISSHNSKLSVEKAYSQESTNFNVNDNQWHRYTVIVEDSSHLKIYKDTELLLDKDSKFSIESSAIGTIGNWLSQGLFWQGWLSEALIYDKALSLDEITQICKIDNI